MVGQLEWTGCIADYTHIWWDIRPHPKWGIEVRICDAVTRVEDAVAIAAYCQALVKALRPLRHRRDPVVPPHPDEREQVACSALWARRTGDGPRDRPTHPHPHREARAPDVPRARAARSRARLGARAREDRGALGRGNSAERQLRSSTRTGTSSRWHARSRTRRKRRRTTRRPSLAAFGRDAEGLAERPPRTGTRRRRLRLRAHRGRGGATMAPGRRGSASARSASTLAAVRSPRARRTVLLRVARRVRRGRTRARRHPRERGFRPVELVGRDPCFHDGANGGQPARATVGTVERRQSLADVRDAGRLEADRGEVQVRRGCDDACIGESARGLCGPRSVDMPAPECVARGCEREGGARTTSGRRRGGTSAHRRRRPRD